MLQWFGKRLKDIREAQKDERGFTLIELLVVVIIIGILAAIAIPVFLAQRERAQDADAESEARNIAAAATAYAADNDGAYTGMAIADLEADYGYNPSGENIVAEVAIWGPEDSAFDVVVTSASGQAFNYDSDRGTVAEGAGNSGAAG